MSIIQNPIDKFRFNPTSDFEKIPYLFFELLDLMNDYSIKRMAGVGIQKATYPTFSERRANIKYGSKNGLTLYEKPLEIIQQIKAQL